MSQTDSRIRILSVDDHPVLREGIAALIEGQPDMELVAEAHNGREAVQAFRSHLPDVTLMDIQMPGINGIEAIVSIRREFPEARIVVLTTYKGDAQARRAFKAGASGYLLKGMLREELLATIRMVHAGKRRIPAEIAMDLAEHAFDASLSEREIEVLRHVAVGNANRKIAQQLRVTEETIKAHMKNISAKLRANDRTHAVTIAIKRGFIDLQEVWSAAE